MCSNDTLLRKKFYEIIDSLKESVLQILEDPDIVLDKNIRSSCISNIEKGHSMMSLLKTANQNAPLNMFKKHVVSRYGEQILNCDDNFIRNFSDKDLESYDVGVNQFAFIKELQAIWNILDAENKMAVLKNIKGLTLIVNKLL